MMRILAFLLAATAAPAFAQDPERGRILYETFCGTCHYEHVHERPPARAVVKSLPDLYQQVAKWAPRTRMKFSIQDIEDVVAYLNRSHYKFPQ